MKENQTNHAAVCDPIIPATNPIAIPATDTSFDDRFIAFAESQLQSWMANQENFSAPVNLAQLSRAVNLYQRLRKLRQPASTPDRAKSSSNLLPAPLLPAPAVPSRIAPQTPSPIQTSSSAPSQNAAYSHAPSPSPVPSPAPRVTSQVASLHGIDPALLSSDLDKLLKEARSMARNMHPNKKRHIDSPRQPIPIPQAACYPQPQRTSLVESLLRSRA